jgi:hypothetical protein
VNGVLLVVCSGGGDRGLRAVGREQSNRAICSSTFFCSGFFATSAGGVTGIVAALTLLWLDGCSMPLWLEDFIGPSGWWFPRSVYQRGMLVTARWCSIRLAATTESRTRCQRTLEG